MSWKGVASSTACGLTAQDQGHVPGHDHDICTEKTGLWIDIVPKCTILAFKEVTPFVFLLLQLLCACYTGWVVQWVEMIYAQKML